MKESGLSLPGLFLAILAVISPALLRAQSKESKSPGERLKFVLVLTRHGVRSPTWTNTRLDEYAKDPWPKWNVAPGMLTPHGKLLMSQFGAYYRAYFAANGLISPAGCADAANVDIDADSDQRTRQTGQGIAEGMLPGCPVEVHALPEGDQDELFHTAGRVGRPDAELAYAAVAGRIGDNPAALLPVYQASLEKMQQVLFGCPAGPCNPGDKKSLLAVPPSLSRGTGDHLVELKGPLSTGATFAENLQLEYLEGMPDAEVGWGRVDESRVQELMAIHAANSNFVQRTPYIARVQASNLLIHMLCTLEQAQKGKPVPGAIGTPSDKIVFLVGHDTNISNVAALLDLHWLVNGYQPDDAAPGGALILELWQTESRQNAVRAYYTVQTPQQMRRSLPLSLQTPPAKAVLFVSGCSKAEAGSPCDLEAFERIVSTAADKAFAK
jgi:4-phytase / acid phosphatase